MMRWLLRPLAISLLLAASLSVFADSTEIQVYRDELPDHGEGNFDFAANISKTAKSSDLKGRSIAQALGEYSYGLTDEWEAGVKLPTYRADGKWYGSGLLGEIKYIALHQDQGFYWGAEIEAGYRTPFLEKRQWVLEAVPILGYRIERWHIAANPGLAIASAGDEHGIVAFDPNGKVSYQLTAGSEIGMEYFVEAGSLGALLPRAKRNEVAYLTLDTKVGKSAVSVGIGCGTTAASPRSVLKLIVDFEFD